MSHRKPSRGAVLLVRDLVHALQVRVESPEADWAYAALMAGRELIGVCRYCLRSEPIHAPDAVFADRWANALIELAAEGHHDRHGELARLAELASKRRAPKEPHSEKTA